jgi:hypothetical protein
MFKSILIAAIALATPALADSPFAKFCLRYGVSVKGPETGVGIKGSNEVTLVVTNNTNVNFAGLYVEYAVWTTRPVPVMQGNVAGLYNISGGLLAGETMEHRFTLRPNAREQGFMDEAEAVAIVANVVNAIDAQNRRFISEPAIMGWGREISEIKCERTDR